ncbi:phosphatase and actin regulator 2 isoform X8 [Rattus norvegicus]|uniref:phosphatase and actin regulator 2 isoform X8 n=1 Tax=Rattus norvegicus TaxID=10116 RepID=UPI0008101D0C|nr:phosphatase and actin regulator 2 isoform X9 [Rattus norvegicus]|eukprot:XP_017444592.1 PREDICTED: phosphatase and actin regulator 2 isoform X7 [Rattus norvegicus]
MAEAGRSPEMSPDQPDGQEAVAAEVPDPEPEAPGPPVPALRWLPGDPSPRGRSQSDLSSASSRGRPLRVHISGSVDGLDKASIANSDGPPAGSQTPPFKRKGKLSTIGKIFKPWKWRKKKTSDKFRETSAAGSSHPKKTTGSKASSSPSASSTSSHPRGPKESLTGKAGAVGTTRGKKKISKQPAAAASRLSPNTVTSETSSLKGELSDTGVESLKPEETVAGAEEEATGKPKAVVVALPPVTVPPSSPALPLPPEDPCTIALDTPMVLVSDGPTLPISALETSPLPGTEEPANRTTPYSSTGLGGSREQAKCFTTKDGPGKAGPQLLTPGQMGDSLESFSAPEDEAPREYQANDSDSDGPILYTDDDDEEDDDDDSTGESALASKIRRRDTLAIKLGNRPSKKELEDKNILQRTSEEERQELRQQIGTKLVRRLSQRPTTEELEQRNILKQKNEEEEQEAKMELKRRLSRKLSLRPTVAELQARRILRFNEYVEVTDSPDYDRRADKPWARLTPADKAAIRKELNEFKSTEMEVHEESRQFTRFHRP